MRVSIFLIVFTSLVCLTVLTPDGLAQSALTGSIKDESGAVLPGASIEAKSEALIEGSRSAVSDERGAYRIIDLRPGTYAMSFSLPGFKTVKREVELPSNFTATIDAQLTVGTVEETVTVSAESPVVDLETNFKAQVLPREVLDSVPTAHTIQSVGQLVVGIQMNLPDVAGSQAMQQTYFTVHGAGTAQTAVLMDGMIINGLQGDGGIQSYLNDAGNQEMVYQTGGGTADSPAGGLKLNMVPKEGGNSLHGSFFIGYESSGLQSSNLSSDLAAKGVKAVDRIGKYRDVDITLGGPIKKDKLWFFGSGRLFTVDKPILNVFWLPPGYKQADCISGVVACEQAVDDQKINSVLLRLTWQVSPRNKFSAYMDRLFKTRSLGDLVAGDDPGTAGIRWNSPIYVTNTIKWTSTLTNRLLVEGGYSSNLERYNNLYAPGIRKDYGSPEWFAGARRVDSILGTSNGASVYERGVYPDRYNAQGSMSYVRGGHNIKVGFQDSWGPFRRWAYANADLYQNYQNGQPNTVTLLPTPANWKEKLNANLGIYAQDAWTIKRLTVTVGLRWEYVSEKIVGQPAQSGRFANIPAFNDINLPIWRSFSPRTAVVYDLFGNRKTAVRFGFNRFGMSATTGLAELYDPGNAVSVTSSPTWNDKNKDDIAQGSTGCDFQNAPDCEINFAQVPKNFGTISLAKFDPKLKRPHTLAYNLGVTHELLPGVSVTAEWFHSELKNILERNNVLRPGTLTGPSTVDNPNYRAVPVFSPIDGKKITMYDPVSSAVQQAVAYVDTNDPKMTQVYNGFEFNFNAKLPRGGRLFGGSSTDRAIANVCSAATTNPNILVNCDQSKSNIPWRTQFKLIGTYPLPWWGIQFSGALQALPGYVLYNNALPVLQQGSVASPNATLNNPNSAGTVFQVTPSTRYTVCPGDSASQGCVVGNLVIPQMIQPQLNVPLIAPGTELTPRLNQVDFSLSKRINFERFRFEPKLDLFNAFNSSDYYAVRSMVYSTVPGAAYKQPSSILQGRILRLAAVVNW
jgi:hypothetical protein